MNWAFLFDLDGTLIDSEVLWVEAIGIALRAKVPQIRPDYVARLVYGRAWTDIYLQLDADHPGVYPTRASMEAVTEPLFEQLSRSRDIRIEPSIRLLRELGASFPLAIVSGSTRARIAESIRRLDIGDCVDAYVGCEDYSPGKPHPAAYLEGARRLGVAPEMCLAFEDSAAGVLSAKAAGMRCIALRRENAGDQDLGAADRVMDTLDGFDAEAFMASSLPPTAAPGGA